MEILQQLHLVVVEQVAYLGILLRLLLIQDWAPALRLHLDKHQLLLPLLKGRLVQVQDYLVLEALEELVDYLEAELKQKLEVIQHLRLHHHSVALQELQQLEGYLET